MFFYKFRFYPFWAKIITSDEPSVKYSKFSTNGPSQVVVNYIPCSFRPTSLNLCPWFSRQSYKSARSALFRSISTTLCSMRAGNWATSSGSTFLQLSKVSWIGRHGENMFIKNSWNQIFSSCGFINVFLLPSILVYSILIVEVVINGNLDQCTRNKFMKWKIIKNAEVSSHDIIIQLSRDHT